MPSFERCEYFSASGSIPAVVLYRTERLVFVQFESRRWPGYQGHCNYVTAAIFPEHLRPVQERPQTTEASSSGRSEEQRSRKTPNELEVSKASAVSEPRPEKNGSKSVGVDCQSRSQPLSKIKVNGKEACGRKPAKVRSIAGFTLADFFYDRLAQTPVNLLFSR
jgi:hypothetical protein